MIALSTAASNQFDVCSSRGPSGYDNYGSQDQFSSVTIVNQALDELFKDFEMERLAGLVKKMTKFMKQVLTRCSKVLELGSSTILSLSAPTMNTIVKKMVVLAEEEPYGIRGGTLVVMFSPPQTSSTYPTLRKIGRFPMDPTMVSTYELHLTLQESCPVKLKLVNLFRKLQGKAAKLVVDEKFVLVKKKLYRSSMSLQ